YRWQARRSSARPCTGHRSNHCRRRCRGRPSSCGRRCGARPSPVSHEHAYIDPEPSVPQTRPFRAHSLPDEPSMPRRSGPHAIWDAEEDATPLVEATIGGLVDRGAILFGPTAALVQDEPEVGIDLRLSFAELRYDVRRLAKGLLAMGIAKGEHVAVF